MGRPVALARDLILSDCSRPGRWPAFLDSGGYHHHNGRRAEGWPPRFDCCAARQL